MDTDGVCSKATASRHFKRWGSHKDYMSICQDTVRLQHELRLLNGEVAITGVRDIVQNLRDKGAVDPNDPDFDFDPDADLT